MRALSAGICLLPPLLFCLLFPVHVRGQTAGTAGCVLFTAAVRPEEKDEDGADGNADVQEDYTEGLLGQIDFSDVDALYREALPGTPERKTGFSDVVEGLITDGVRGFDLSLLAGWLRDAIFYEIGTNRTLLIEIVLLAVGFSILKNFVGAFRSSYISDLCFLMVYCVLGVMLLQSFAVFGGIVRETMTHSVDFMRALVPAISVTMVFSAGPGTGAGFYQTAFLVIYLIQWGFLELLMPLARIYAILQLFNHFFEDEKFANLTELLNGIICWGMKIAGISVLGLSVVQSMIAAAKDRLTGGGITRAAPMIPGIGNVVSGIGQVLVSSGILIKNCVGAAALIALIAIGLVPMIKIACLALFYKLAAAVTEPVADQRIVGCLKGMSEGGMLYLKLMGYCLALFFLTIALTTAVSGFLM